jgi:hypothetical protein
MHFLKTWLTCSRIFLGINTYSFLEFIPNFTNALYTRFLNSFSHQVSNIFPIFFVFGVAIFKIVINSVHHTMYIVFVFNTPRWLQGLRDL